MADKDEEFLKRLLAIFGIEAREHVDALFSGLAELEKMPDEAEQASIVEAIFREAHSLKGAARSVNLTQVEAACQSLESTFSAMKRKEISLSVALIDGLHQELNRLSALLDPAAPAAPLPQSGDASDAPAAGVPEPKPKPEPSAGKEEDPLPPQAADPAMPEPAEPPPPSSATAKPARHMQKDRSPVTGTVRIAAEKLDSIFLQSEEMLSVKLQAQQRLQELRALHAAVAAWAKDWAGIKTRHPGFYRALASEPQWLELLEEHAAFIKSLNYQLGMLGKAAGQDQRMLGKMVDDLLENTKKALMLPFSTLMEIFPRLVRDLARDSGKEIDLDIHGSELEADRRILEEIKDPLIHLLRNSVDHGIGAPAARALRNKPPRGKISIAIVPKSGNRVEISIADDGEGIDAEKVQAAAARLGILEPQEASRLDEGDAMELIYQSGVSTSPIITEVSGRGLGLAIVREKVDRLGGSIAVETQAGVGTCFRIELPLTLAIYSGIVVRVGEQWFVLPTSHVKQSVRVAQGEVQTVENRATIRLDGETLALAWLADVLGVPQQPASDDALLQVAVLTAGGRRMAFVVDEVVGEQEVLVKSLGRQLARVRNISAATILGSGKAVPILNVADLLRSAQQPVAGRSEREAAAEEKPAAQQAVLVVEDSITARSLLKGILEVAGYKVATAVDGIDGLTQLRSGTFDIVVSDVDMPRMNGFDLTMHIRSDKKLAELPVVLVTALESREDRERGIDVGANAYIVKRSFEQSNLLEVIRRLI